MDTQNNTNQEASPQAEIKDGSQGSPSASRPPERRSVYLISITLERDRHLDAQRKAEDAWSRLTQKQTSYARDLTLLAAYHEDLAIFIHEKIRDFKDSLSALRPEGPGEPCEPQPDPSTPHPQRED